MSTRPMGILYASLGASLALCLGACETVPPDKAPVADLALPSPVRPAITAAADDPALLNGPGTTAFKLASMRFLQLRLAIPLAPAGVFWMTQSIYTPQGHFYSSQHIPYSTDPTVTEVASPDGVAHPIRVRHPQVVPGGFGLDAQILIGGSNMTRRPNPGAWKVVMELDGDPASRAETTLDFGMTL